jgi:hypothetical protein
MSNASALKEYRQVILEQILNNKTICELVLNRTISVVDADIQTELTDYHIFKFPYVPDSVDEEKTFITFDMGGDMDRNSTDFKNMSIYMFIFSHKKIIKDSTTGDLRTDLIDEQIQGLFNNQDCFGLGLIRCQRDDYLSVGSNFHGRRLTFVTKELDRDFRSS